MGDLIDTFTIDLREFTKSENAFLADGEPFPFGVYSESQITITKVADDLYTVNLTLLAEGVTVIHAEDGAYDDRVVFDGPVAG